MKGILAKLAPAMKLALRPYVLASAAALAGLCAHAQDSRPLVAVLESVGSGELKAGTEVLVSGILEQSLMNSKKFRFVDRALIEQTLKEHQIARESLFENNAAKELGNMVQADIVCASELRKADDQIIVRGKLINIVTGEIFASATQRLSGESYEDMQKDIEAAAETMIRQMETPEETMARQSGGLTLPPAVPAIPESLSGKFPGKWNLNYTVSVNADNTEVVVIIRNTSTVWSDVAWELAGASNLRDAKGNGRVPRNGAKSWTLEVLNPKAPVALGEILFTLAK
jgi:TolB-like protein